MQIKSSFNLSSSQVACVIMYDVLKLRTFKLFNYLALEDVTPLTLGTNVALNCLVLGNSLTLVSQEHVSGKSAKYAAHEHISSWKDCHSYSIDIFNALAQANTYLKDKINKALYEPYNEIYHFASSCFVSVS